MADVNIANYPGAAKIEKVVYYTANTEQDITALIKEINIHSALNISSSFCSVTIIDRDSWLESLAFTSGDVVEFEIHHNELGSYTYRYRVKSIETITNLQGTLTYSLKGITDSQYNSYHEKISKSFKGKPSDIFTSIAKNHLAESIGYVEPSAQNIYFIAPGWSVLETIQELAKKSSTIVGNSRMIVFQDSKQRWNFTSLSGLRNKNVEDIITYRYFANTSFYEPEKKITNIIHLRYLDAFNIEDEIEKGQVKNTFMNFDPNTKTMVLQSNSYFDTYSKTTINSKNIWKDENLKQGNIVYTTYPSMLGDFKNAPTDSSFERFEYSRPQQIEIVVHGTPLVDVGSVVNIEIPKIGPARSNITELDTVWSGLYYVAAKRDSYKSDGHTVALRLTKDSFRSDR